MSGAEKRKKCRKEPACQDRKEMLFLQGANLRLEVWVAEHF